MVIFRERNANIHTKQNLRTSQGYIFIILQHFATNFAILLILSYGNGPTVPYLKNLFILVIILCTEDSF
jgi:hypothetical protein